MLEKPYNAGPNGKIQPQRKRCSMARRAGRGKSRIDLRREAEAAERSDGEQAEGGEPSEAAGEPEAKPKKAAKTPRKKAATVKKPTTRRKSSKKKAAPTRLRMFWGVFDNSNSQVAIFPYPERAAAVERATELGETKSRGPYFVQPVKEPIPIEPTPEEA